MTCAIAIGSYLLWQSEKKSQEEENKNKVELILKKLSEEQESVKHLDQDGDGLTDEEEIKIYGTDSMNEDTDGDGFKDGEEVVRGYNPNKPYSEGDQVVPDLENASDPNNLSNKLVGILSQSIDVNEIGTYGPEEISAMVDVYLGDVDVSKEVPEIKDSEIIISSEEVNKATVEKFLNTKSNTLVSLKELLQEKDSVSQLINEAKRGDYEKLDVLVGATNKAYFEVKAIPVPNDAELVDLHKGNLKLIIMLKAMFEDIKAVGTDPVKSAIGMKISQDAATLAEENQARIKKIREKFQIPEPTPGQ